jgi:hypothetical protein
MLMNVYSSHKREYIVSSEDSSLNNFNQKPGKEKEYRIGCVLVAGLW